MAPSPQHHLLRGKGGSAVYDAAANILGGGRQGKAPHLGLAVEELLSELKDTASRDAARDMFIHKKTDANGGASTVATRDSVKGATNKIMKRKEMEQRRQQRKAEQRSAAAEAEA